MIPGIPEGVTIDITAPPYRARLCKNCGRPDIEHGVRYSFPIPVGQGGIVNLTGYIVDCPRPDTAFWLPTTFEPMPYPALTALLGYDAVKAGLS